MNFTKIILECINEYLEGFIREERAGFRNEPTCADQSPVEQNVEIREEDK